MITHHNWQLIAWYVYNDEGAFWINLHSDFSSVSTSTTSHNQSNNQTLKVIH